MGDQPVRTGCITDAGSVSLQEYFVREQLRPGLVAIELEGADAARPAEIAVEALSAADLIVIGPSNPFVSIDPILRVLGRSIPRAKTVAVTPLVGGVALKGPTAQMMEALGMDVSPVEVAKRYHDVCSTFVIDEQDRQLAPAVERL